MSPRDKEPTQADIKKWIAELRAKGYITHDDLNRILPFDQFSSEDIEDIMALLSELGINLVEDE